VARRATKIKEIREQAQGAVLVLDAGNTLFDQMLALQSQGRVIVEAMNAMGYDAMAVGQLDLAKGVEVLLARAKEASFAVLSCNLVAAKDQKPILKPYTVLERKGVRYGLIGVTELAAIEAPGVRDVAQVLDPVETVRKVLSEVRAQSDVVIVLSHLGIDQDRVLAEAVPGIDVIIGGLSRQILQAPEVVGKTVISQMGYDGEWLGRLDLALEEGARLRDPKLESIVLGPEVPDDAGLAELVASYKEQFPQPTEAAK
jgi:2',3'-cyclic-nucleotide 2'-phosphodiesterase (5'-nucleotidase family)